MVKVNRKAGSATAKAGSSTKKATAAKKIKIDCSIPVTDDILESEQFNNFETFLTSKIKVNGKTNQLGDSVKISKDEDKHEIQVEANIQISKRYVKYLTKKFLKKNKLREWIRVVSSSKDTYQMRYFNIRDDGDEDAEE
eukprot:gene20183-7235_t